MARSMKTRTTKRQKKKQSPRQHDEAAPLIEHLYELRRRVFYCVVSIAVVAIAAYFVQQHLVNALLYPAHGQQFIYTSVGGGISFLFKLCSYVGVAVSLPVIAYNILGYLQPLLRLESKRFIATASIVCGLLALAGMSFGYFVGLPAALHFLLHQFTTKQIHPLLTIQEYMSFVTAYMLGSALLFQIPLFLLFINRIRPLKPRRLWHYERWVILGAFVASGLMNPTPEIVSQLALAGPIIVMYQIGIIIIWRVNAHRARSPFVQQLIDQDSEIKANRQKIATEQLLAAEPLPAVDAGPQLSLESPDALVQATASVFPHCCAPASCCTAFTAEL
jgi:sec-independent protein translocase protein TatC